MKWQTKLSYLFFLLTVLSILFHNVFFGFFEKEEVVFFFLTFLFLIGFVISVVYNLITYSKRGQPEDLWKLGWLGIFGLIGLFLNLNFGFFGFFGLKKNKTAN